MKCHNILTQMLKTFELTLISVNELDAKPMNWYLSSLQYSNRRRAIFISSDVQRVYRCSKTTFILPQTYHASVVHMLS